MKKYIARVTHETRGTFYRRNPGPLGPWWSEDIDQAHRYDDKESALKACSNVASDYTKEALVAPEDRIYAAARSRRNGDLYYRAKASSWYLTSFTDTAHEFKTRFEASASFEGVNPNFWDFKFGTMDEIGKWYDQFGKPETSKFEPGGVIFRGQVPLAHLHLSSDGEVTVNQDRHSIGVEGFSSVEPAPKTPEVVTARRAIEGAVDAELNWDLDKIGTIVGFLGELPADLLDEDKLSAGTLYEVLANLHEELGGE